MPMYMTKATERQCRNILCCFFDEKDVSVVALKGTGHQPQLEEDVKIIQAAVHQLQAR
jgi:hypothetical protein